MSLSEHTKTLNKDEAEEDKASSVEGEFVNLLRLQ